MKAEELKKIKVSEDLKKLIREGQDAFGAEIVLALCSNLSGALKEYQKGLAEALKNSKKTQQAFQESSLTK